MKKPRLLLNDASTAGQCGVKTKPMVVSFCLIQESLVMVAAFSPYFSMKSIAETNITTPCVIVKFRC